MNSLNNHDDYNDGNILNVNLSNYELLNFSHFIKGSIVINKVSLDNNVFIEIDIN